MKINKIWFRDRIVDESEALISVLAPTAQFGLNAFEGIRCYWNDEKGELFAFRLDDHIKRLMISCKMLRIKCPFTEFELVNNIQKTIRANGLFQDSAVRLTVFVDGTGSWHTSEPTSAFITATPKQRTDIDRPLTYKACISSWQRINDNVMPPRVKVGANYINGRYAHLQAKSDGYDIPIFLGEDGEVAEGAGACVMIVRDGVLITPPCSASILESITRDTLLRLAVEIGYKVKERAVDRTELYLADEVFLCGSAVELSPIVSVDGYKVGVGVPGCITMDLMKKYFEIASGVSVKFPHWITVVNTK